MSSQSNVDQINGLMLNYNGNCIGTTSSKFIATEAQMIFVWELTTPDIKAAAIRGSAISPSVKDIEFYSDALYSGTFSLTFDENGAATIHATIFRQENVTAKIAINSIHFYYIIDGTTKCYGNFISRSFFTQIIAQNGRIEIFADLKQSNANLHVPHDDYDENMGLPMDLE